MDCWRASFLTVLQKCSASVLVTLLPRASAHPASAVMGLSEGKSSQTVVWPAAFVMLGARFSALMLLPVTKRCVGVNTVARNFDGAGTLCGRS